jgi:hypothetical protein
MDELKIVTYIKTTLTREGNGTDDPVRVITQWWDFEGNLLFEYDPTEGTFTRIADPMIFID